MEKNKNVDIVRAVACLLVLFYHCWVLGGGNAINVPVIREYIMLGGNVGVTAFFVLSGYGIYCSLYTTECTGKIDFFSFMRKRLRRVAPHYYFNLLIALLFTGSAVYIAKEHIWSIITHIFFVHSFSVAWHGAINGGLWTMAIMMQFYVLAIPLYYFINKCKEGSVLVSVMLTISLQFVMVNYVWVLDEEIYGAFAYSIPNRQIFTSLDNFVIGMYIAYLKNNVCSAPRQWVQKLLIVLAVIMVYLLCKTGISVGIWGNNLWNCSFHSLLALLIGVIVYCACQIDCKKKSLIYRALLWVSKYEYGIYLWHLIIINNLLQYSAMIKELIANKQYLLVRTIFSCCSILVGWVMTELVTSRTIRNV